MTSTGNRTALFGAISLCLLLGCAALANAASVTWTGAANNVWQDGDSGNWDATFNNGDDVTFDDTGSNTAISVSGAVSQIGMLFNNSAVDYSFSTTAIGGTGGVTKNGTGLVTFNVNNTFTGKTVLNGGTVSIAADARLGAAPGSPVADQLTFDGGTLRATSGFTLAVNRGITVNGGGGTLDVLSGTVTYAGTITGSGNLAKNGPGTLVLSGNNISTFTGNLTIDEGVLNITTLATSLGDPNSSVVTVNNGARVHFSAGGNFTWANDFILDGGELRNNISSNNNLTGEIALTADSTISNFSTSGGVFDIRGDITGSSQLTILSGGNFRPVRFSTVSKTYTGPTLVEGSLEVLSSSGISSGSLTFNNPLVGGTARTFALSLSNSAQTIGPLSGFLADAGGGHALNLNLGSNHDLTINQTADGVFDGRISGTNAEIILSAASTNTLTLTDENTYSGGTTINGGTLLLNNTSGSGTGTGGVVVNAGGGLGGTGSVSGTVTVNDGLITPGASAGVFNIGGDLNYSGGSLFIEVTGGGGTPGVDHDQVSVAGNATGLSTVDLIVDISVGDFGSLQDDILTILTSTNDLTGLSFNSVTFLGPARADVTFGPGGIITLSNFQVPEPSTAGLLSLGLVGLLHRRRSAVARRHSA